MSKCKHCVKYIDKKCSTVNCKYSKELTDQFECKPYIRSRFVKIKEGAMVSIDFRTTTFPMVDIRCENGDCYGHPIDLETVFEVRDLSSLDNLNCEADGFGVKGNYGNGSIMVHGGWDSVIPVETPNEI